MFPRLHSFNKNMNTEAFVIHYFLCRNKIDVVITEKFLPLLVIKTSGLVCEKDSFISRATSIIKND